MQASPFDSSMDYLKYPTFGPLPTDVRSHDNAIRCKGCGSTNFHLRPGDMKPVCAQCGREIMPEKTAQVLHLSRPEKPLFQIASSMRFSTYYILRPDGTVRTVNSEDARVGTAFEGDRIISIAGGDHHLAALRSDGTVAVLGDSNLPQCQVQHWTDLVAIAATNYQTIGLRSDGTVVTAGEGWWKIDPEKSWSGITAIAASTTHAVGLRSDGTVVTAGSNDGGECAVGHWSDMKQIAVSFEQTVGLCQNGTVRAVGNNEFGQCEVGSWNGITSVYAIPGATIGLRADGSVLSTGKAIPHPKTAEDRRFNELFLKRKQIMESWRKVEQIASDGDLTAALHSDGTISYILPEHMSKFKSLLRRPIYDRAFKKVFA